MRFIKLTDALKSSELLLEQNEFEQMARVLTLGLAKSQDQEAWQKTQKFLERIPHRVRVETLEIAFLYAKALMFNDELQTLLDFNTQTLHYHEITNVARIQLECAKSLLAFRRYSEAREMLETILPYLHGQFLGIALGKLGMTLFSLGEPWQEAFSKASEYLSGVELGYVLFNQGTCLDLCNRGDEARVTWTKALTFLKSDLKMLTWIRFNMGISALRDLESEAERHFLEAQRLTKNPKAAALQAAVLNGLAASRRVLGEWNRAEAAYRESIRIAQDSHERENAYLGLARTLRLAGRVSESLETLEFALCDETLNHDVIQVSRAKVFLALGQSKSARDALTRVGNLVTAPHQWLEKIALAELERRDGNLENAVKLLEGLPIETLHAREEARSFPDLMLLLKVAGKPVPKPLEYLKGMTVRVVAQGVLSVRVNDRPVAIAPTGRAGELLVYLLEQNGAATLDMIADAMFSSDGIPEREMVRRLTWRLIKSLRQAFGWESSIVSLRAAYQLDPNVTWEYDVKESRATRNFQGEFLKGVYSNWALETGRTLEGNADLRRRSSDLN